jgi:hypothetical protein
MAYGKKYIFSAISKSGLTYTAEMWENGYTGAEYNVNSGMSPFVLTCAGSGDDPFQPILPTIFNIRADFTDFTGPYPDLVSTDDRKYYVRFVANNGTYFIWQGFVLMDSIAIPFTTGRNFVDIICVDGLGLLKTVPYQPTSATINTSESLLQIIRNCLLNISYPVTIYINSAINYYATAHSTAESYIRKTHIFPTSWTNSDFTFKSCYDVLQEICVAHGAQLYQSGGEWWITSVNERASDTLRVFRTDNTSATDTLSTVNINRRITPYQSDVLTPYYFIDNGQTKIIKKGFTSLEVVSDLNYAENTVENGNMFLLEYGTGIPTNWSRTLGSGGTFGMTTVDGIYGAQITPGTTNTTFTALSCGVVNEGDILTIEFQTKCNVIGNLEVEILLTSGMSTSRYVQTISGAGTWGPSPTYYLDEITNTNLQKRTITTTPASITGNLTITFRTISTGITNVFVANLKKTASSTLAKKQTLYNQTSNNIYKKSINSPIGGPFPITNVSQIQSILSVSDNALTTFSRFSGGPSYSTLAVLLFSQLYNIYGKANINLQLTQYNLFTGSKVIGLVDNFGVEDPTSVISIDTSRFVFSSCTLDYVNNTISGTALEVSNTNLPYTLVSSIPPTPPTVCYNWYNNSAANWLGDYVACDGTSYPAATLTPGQFVCAQGTPFTLTGTDLEQGAQC